MQTEFIEKLALGTVQFGLNYGVANQSGQVSKDEVSNILSFARSIRIDTLDTAPRYGNSEYVLGRIGVHDYRVVTKTTSLKHGIKDVIEGFYRSLKSLNQRSVDGLLIHDINEVDEYVKVAADWCDRFSKIAVQSRMRCGTCCDASYRCK